MKWRAPRLPKVAHVALAMIIAVVLEFVGAYIVGSVVTDDHLAIGLSLLMGFILGACVVAYWEEVIDR
jgi:hypothetical protein